MKVCRFGKTQIKVHWLLLVFVAVWVVGGFALQACALFLALLLHELAHIGVARFLGVRVWELELLPFGCRAQLDDVFEEKPGQEAAIAAAGPLSSLFLGLGIAALRDKLTLPADVAAFLGIFVQYCYILAAFNLIPALPLDGGRVLRAGISRRHDAGRATRICALLGIFIAAGLVGYAAYRFITVSEISFLPALAVFLLLSAISELKNSRFERAKAIANRTLRQNREDSYHIKTIAVYYDMPLSSVLAKFSDSHYYVVNVMDKEMRILGALDEKTLEDAFLESRGSRPIGSLLRTA